MPEQKPIYFYGDPHGDFGMLLLLAEFRKPSTVVIVGDFELSGPIKEVLKPLFERGFDIHWIFGNHDTDTCQQADYLLSPTGGHPEANLHCKVVDIGGIRIAGLGGVFKGRVWMPDEEVRYASRADWLRRNRERWRGGLPIHLIDTIFPEDFVTLGKLRADVLVTHEGPSSVWQGMGHKAMDDLAAKMGCSLIIHGHHHHSEIRTLENGIEAVSLGKAELWELQREDFDRVVREVGRRRQP
jgi:predicted phosphodiesterase